MRRISGAGFWHFQISGPDPDPANRLPDIRIRQTAGYPESGKQTAGYPDPARMEKLFYSAFNLEEVNLKLKFSTIHQNCQYPAGYPDSGKQAAGYPESGGETKS